MTAFQEYLGLVKRLTTSEINRSENDLSANLKNALSEFGLNGVLDTGAGTNVRKRPDIALYVSLDDADAGSAADIVIESKKPEEVVNFASLEEALIDDTLWNDKFVPYVAAHIERVSYFVLTAFESFLVVPISDALRRDLRSSAAFTAKGQRKAALAHSRTFNLRDERGASEFLNWCKIHIIPTALKPPELSSILDLRALTNADELEVFANELADVVVGPEERPAPGGALLSSIRLHATQPTDLSARAHSALLIYTMSAHGGMSVEDANAHLQRHLEEELGEFVGASIHSLVGRLFAVKTIEDAFCIDVSPPLLPKAHWIFHNNRFDGLSDERLPAAFFEALGALDHSESPAVRDLAATGRFYDWLAPQVDPAAFRRLLTPFFVHSFRDLDGDLLGRFFEIYAQRLDRQRRRELGQYYTPMQIVRYMWREAMKLARERKVLGNILVLDPGVGSGTFLIEGARQLEQEGIQRFWERLHGFDIAPQVIAIAQVNLYLTVLGLLNRGEAENVGTLKLYPTDALDPRNGARLRNVLPLLIDESTRQFLERRIIMSEEIKRSSHFTLVIGNPPYKNNSTRTLAQVASVFPPLLRSSRENARARERNIRDDYAWFFAAADHYTTDRGLIAFVVSDSFCYARSYRFFREDLLRRYRVVQLVHLGRFVFRDVGPRTSFIIVLLERLQSELPDAAQTSEIPYIDLRPMAASFSGAPGTSADPRLSALANGPMPDARLHTPERNRDFALLPAGNVVQKVLRAPIILHGRTPRRVFIKKWPGIITAFDKLFKSDDRDSLVHRLETFFDIAHADAPVRENQLMEFGRSIGLNNEEQNRCVNLANQAVTEAIQFRAENARRVLTGSAPNDDAWYPSERMIAWLYYEPQLLVPRNVNPGRNAGWGSMSQWREPESHSILPKLAFTTSTNPQAGLKAFVLNDDWIVKLAAGTRQQLNYTGVSNPLAPDSLSGPNNLGSEALELFAALQTRGLSNEDFLLYVAGIYNSRLSEEYLSAGGSNILRIPVDPQKLDLEIVLRIVATSRRILNLRRLRAEAVQRTELPATLALSLTTETELEELGFSLHRAGGGRFRQSETWRMADNTVEGIDLLCEQLSDTLNQDIDAIFEMQ